MDSNLIWNSEFFFELMLLLHLILLMLLTVGDACFSTVKILNSFIILLCGVMCVWVSVRHFHYRWIKNAGTKETWKKEEMRLCQAIVMRTVKIIRLIFEGIENAI